MELPKVTQHYTTLAEDETLMAQLAAGASEFFVWASMEDDSAVRLRRAEVTEPVQSDGTRTKVARFEFVPTGMLATGEFFYAKREYRDARVLCAWSDYLRISRRRPKDLPSSFEREEPYASLFRIVSPVDANVAFQLIAKDVLP